MIQPLGWEKFFASFGSGIGLVNRIYKIEVSEEVSKDKKSIKLGIPIEFKIGFLYHQRSLRLVDFTF